jgi:hypothetical protein
MRDNAASDTSGDDVPPQVREIVLAPVEPRPRLLRKYTPIAAAIALAVALGAIVGASAGVKLSDAPDTTASIAAAATETRTLADTVARLNGELTKLKASSEAAQRNAAAQIGKLTERLERAEKAQSEPAAKLAKLTESVERLEKRPQPQPVAAAAAGDVTGSVPAPKPGNRLIAEGWRVLDYYAGRAMVENRNGTLFEVEPGISIPGLGRIESVRRDNGRVVIMASNGTISGMVMPRRGYRPYY